MQRFSIYIPTNPKYADHYIRNAMIELSQLAGGASKVDITSSYLNTFHVLVHEPVTVVSVIADVQTGACCKYFLMKLAAEIKEGLNQECVLVTVEDVKEFVLV